MGADGGIVAYKFKTIEKEWNKIKGKLFDLFSSKTVNGSWRRSNHNYLYSEAISQLILDKNELGTAEEFCNWFKNNIYRDCDTPHPLGEYIIFPYGNNVPDETGDITDCFSTKEYINIETWT